MSDIFRDSEGVWVDRARPAPMVERGETPETAMETPETTALADKLFFRSNGVYGTAEAIEFHKLAVSLERRLRAQATATDPIP